MPATMPVESDSLTLPETENLKPDAQLHPESDRGGRSGSANIFHHADVGHQLRLLAIENGDTTHLSNEEAARFSKLCWLTEEPSRKPLLFGTAMMREELEELRITCPPFVAVTDLVDRAVALSLLAEAPLSIPPLLLAGPPGTGKTHYSKALAKVLGVPVHAWSCATNSDAMQLITGHPTSWRGARMGLLTEALVTSSSASPVFLFDEVDKFQTHRDEQPYNVLLNVLEGENAAALLDEYLRVRFDASHAVFIGTANDVSVLPGFIQDRFLIIPIAAPTGDALIAVTRQIAAKILAPLGLPMPSDDTWLSLPSATRAGSAACCGSRSGSRRPRDEPSSRQQTWALPMPSHPARRAALRSDSCGPGWKQKEAGSEGEIGMPPGSPARKKSTMKSKIDRTTKKPFSKRKIGSPLLPAGSAGAVTRWYPTRWPRIGGKALLPLPSGAFTEKRYLAAYNPGKLVFIYVAGSGEDHSMPTVATGLLGLARRLKMPVHKVSVTAQVNLRDRLRELNADRYGALTTSPDGYPCSDLGFDNWAAQHILPRSKPLNGSPVVLAERCLAVRLPANLSIREFDKRLHHRMCNAALNPWLRSEAGQIHCDLIGIPPEQLLRATAYGFGELVRASEAQEFYVFRPKSFDADRLVRIAEVIIHDHVVLPRTRSALAWKSRGQGFGTMTSSG